MLIFGVQFRVLSDTVEPGIEGIWLGLICSDGVGQIELGLALVNFAFVGIYKWLSPAES
jgi:hypothetical protein